MYNFNEIKSLNELKEMCFYIKAFSEIGVKNIDTTNEEKIKTELKNRYNLKVTTSRLYLFVNKIQNVTQNEKALPLKSEISGSLFSG